MSDELTVTSATAGQNYVRQAGATITFKKGFQATQGFQATEVKPDYETSFQYGSGGERVYKRDEALQGSSDLKTIYIRGLNNYPIAVRTKDQLGNESVIRFIKGSNGLVGTKETSGNYFVLRDHIGSSRIVLQDNGTVSSTYNYLPMGGLMNSTVSDNSPYRFQGQEYDSETGLHNFRAKFYDDELGRFYGTDPQNQFASPYVGIGNNAVNGTDPDGEWVHIAAAAAVIGGGINLAMNWKNIQGGNIWEKIGHGSLYFATGAAAGAVGATGNFAAAGAILGGGNAAVGGGSAQDIAFGTVIGGIAGGLGGLAGGGVSSALASKGVTGFAGGFASGLTGGAIGGFINSFGSTTYATGDISQGWKAGSRGALYGGLAGGLIGGVSSGINALRNPNVDLDGNINQRNFWTGKNRGSGRGAFAFRNTDRISAGELQRVVSPETISKLASEYRISASQTEVTRAGVQKYYNQMRANEFNPSAKQNIIGGFVKNGEYIVQTGHHRVSAALAYGMRTGNYTIIEALINGGRWTPYYNHGVNGIPFPLTWK